MGSRSTFSRMDLYFHTLNILIYIFVTRLKDVLWNRRSIYSHRWTPTKLFLVVSMIWCSHTQKLYIKMMGYPWEIDSSPLDFFWIFCLNKVNNKNDMAPHAFGLFLFQPTAMRNRPNSWKRRCCYSSLYIFLVNMNSNRYDFGIVLIHCGMLSIAQSVKQNSLPQST